MVCHCRWSATADAFGLRWLFAGPYLRFPERLTAPARGRSGSSDSIAQRKEGFL